MHSRRPVDFRSVLFVPGVPLRQSRFLLAGIYKTFLPCRRRSGELAKFFEIMNYGTDDDGHRSSRGQGDDGIHVCALAVGYWTPESFFWVSGMEEFWGKVACADAAADWSIYKVKRAGFLLRWTRKFRGWIGEHVWKWRMDRDERDSSLMLLVSCKNVYRWIFSFIFAFLCEYSSFTSSNVIQFILTAFLSYSDISVILSLKPKNSLGGPLKAFKPPITNPLEIPW